MEYVLKKLTPLRVAVVVGIGIFHRGLEAAHLSEVIALIKEGRLAEARRITSGWDASSDAHLFVKGVLEPRPDQAIRHFETLLNRFPQSPYGDQTRFRIGQYRYMQGRYRESRALFKHILIQDPSATLGPQCKRWIAYTYRAEGKADSAALFAEIPQETSQTLSPAPPPPPPTKPVRQEPSPGEIMKRDPAPLPSPSRLPSASPKPSPPTPSARPTPTGERYAVQVGAFTQERGALLRKAFFEREGYQVSIQTKTRDGTIFYTVWILPFLPAEEARAIGSQIKQKYGIDYVLVTE